MAKKVIIAFLGNAKYDARCINMANSLFNNGFKVIIIDEEDPENENLGSNSFEVRHVKTLRKSGFIRYWNYHCKLQKIARQVKPDIFISADLFSLAVCSNQNINCLKIYDSRELYSKLTSLVGKPIKQLFWSFFERKYYKNVNKVLVSAEKDREFLISRFGYKDIQLIFNFPNIQKKTSKINLCHKFNISEKKKIFLYQGAIQIGRGIEEMISLLNYFEDCVACIVGDGEHKREIIKLSEKLKISNRVFYTGKISYNELISVSKQADIGFSLIQPLSDSYKQALPNKLFEYGLAGTPVIASDFPEMKYYINKYKLGIAVNPINEKEHLDAVNRLLKWKHTAELITNVEDNLTWESQEHKFIQLFNL